MGSMTCARPRSLLLGWLGASTHQNRGPRDDISGQGGRLARGRVREGPVLIRNPDVSSGDLNGTKLFELTRHFFPEDLQVIEAKTKKPDPGCEAGVADDGQGEGVDFGRRQQRLYGPLVEVKLCVEGALATRPGMQTLRFVSGVEPRAVFQGALFAIAFVVPVHAC